VANDLQLDGAACTVAHDLQLDGAWPAARFVFPPPRADKFAAGSVTLNRAG
jgi:hypothetical protein